MNTYTTDEIKSWLKCALVAENLTEMSVNTVGNSGRGDGYIGDILFAKVEGKTAEAQSKTYDLVLKCSKQSEALRATAPVKETFENEIHIYSEIIPAFTKFQQDRGIKDVFSSVPEYFGKFMTDNMEMLALQNLKELGYGMHNPKEPFDIDHINLLMREYGKWHAVSAAMQDQEPEVFEGLVGGLRDVWRGFSLGMDMANLFIGPIEEMHGLLKEDLSESNSDKMMKFKGQVKYINEELVYNRNRFSVITHGDNWNNNFMFQYEGEDQTKPLKVAMVDWQLSKFTSPVVDLSYFLYSCTSPEDFRKFDEILKEYYESFSNHLKKLGSAPEKLYPYSQLMEDWKFSAKFGLMVGTLALKASLVEKDDVKDFAEIAESGADLSTTFMYEVKDKDKIKKRVLACFEHAIKHDVI